MKFYKSLTIKVFILVSLFSGGFFCLSAFAEETTAPPATPPEKTAELEKAQNNCLYLPDQTFKYFPLSSLGQFGTGPHQGVHTQSDWEGNNAVDLFEKEGTPVIAVEGGEIAESFGRMADASGGASGSFLYLKADTNIYYYAHLKDVAPGIAAGKKVLAGDILGYVGSINSVSHLHFAVKPPSNPEKLLAPFYQCAAEKDLKKPWLWPVSEGAKSNDYGVYMNNDYDGITISSGKTDANVLAPAEGIVRYIYKGGDLGITPYYGLGKVLILQHDKNGETFFTLYGYCADIFVKEGQVVKQGDIIAKEGNSGLLSSLKMNAITFKYGKTLPVSKTNTRDPLVYFK